MKKPLFLTLLVLCCCTTAWSQKNNDDEQKIFAYDMKLHIDTKNCEDVDWQKYRESLADFASLKDKRFTIEIERKSTTGKSNLPTVTTFSLKGRNPLKTLNKAEKMCPRILNPRSSTK